MTQYDAVMRTTIDLPDDLHQIVSAVARDRHQTLSQTVSDLLRRAFRTNPDAPLETDHRTGLPTVRLGHPVTSEDVRRLEDDI